MAISHNQHQEIIETPCTKLGLKARRAAGLQRGTAQSEKHAIDPRLGERRGVARSSESDKHVLSGKTSRSFRSLALPVPDRIGLASEAALHVFAPITFHLSPLLPSALKSFRAESQKGVSPQPLRPASFYIR